MDERRTGLRAGERVLVTGHRGLVGPAVVAALPSADVTVVGLDLIDGDDITRPATARERLRVCSEVHLAALHDEIDERIPSGRH